MSKSDANCAKDQFYEPSPPNSPQNGDEQSDVIYKSDVEALAGRAEALQLFNEQKYDESIPGFISVLRHFTKQYGQLSSKCALYYLDYGVALLSSIQGKNPADAMLPLNEEDAELCFTALEMARVTYQKADSELDKDLRKAKRGKKEEKVKAVIQQISDIQGRLAEVHDALAQLELERDNSQGALAEFETELLILKGIPDETRLSSPANVRAMMSTMYNMARCFLFEGDYEQGADRLQDVLNYIKEFPENTFDAETVQEVTRQYEDAVDCRDNHTYEKVRETVQQLYGGEREIPQLQTESVTDSNYSHVGKPHGAHVAEISNDDHGSHLSHGLIPTARLADGENRILTFASSNGENSCSISRMPLQCNTSLEHSRNTAGSKENSTVNVLVARKRPKLPTGAVPAPASVAQPALEAPKAEDRPKRTREDEN